MRMGVAVGKLRAATPLQDPEGYPWYKQRTGRAHHGHRSTEAVQRISGGTEHPTPMIGICCASAGLECPLATRLISATQKNPEHYLTVLRSPTKDDQDPDPAAKSNLERFLWNFLALRTSVGPGSSQKSGEA